MNVDEKTRIAWTRFTNGLRLAGKQRHLIMRMVRDLREELRKAEQAQWNAETTLKRLVRDGCAGRFYAEREKVEE